MKRTNRARSVLIAVNALLLGVLVVVSVSPGQPAAPGPASRARGQYTLVSNKVSGGSSSQVFILDSANDELIAVKWDRAGQRLEAIGFRDIVNDSAANGRGR